MKAFSGQVDVPLIDKRAASPGGSRLFPELRGAVQRDLELADRFVISAGLPL
jgi:hypothetical protein